MHHIHKFTALLLVISYVIECGCSKSTEYNSSKKNDPRPDHNNTYLKYSKQSLKRGGIGLSAWGIIMLMLAVIISGIIIYYSLLFYPILCRKEGKYDFIEHSRDTTPSPPSNNVEKM